MLLDVPTNHLDVKIAAGLEKLPHTLFRCVEYISHAFTFLGNGMQHVLHYQRSKLGSDQSVKCVQKAFPLEFALSLVVLVESGAACTSVRRNLSSAQFALTDHDRLILACFSGLQQFGAVRGINSDMTYTAWWGTSSERCQRALERLTSILLWYTKYNSPGPRE